MTGAFTQALKVCLFAVSETAADSFFESDAREKVEKAFDKLQVAVEARIEQAVQQEKERAIAIIRELEKEQAYGFPEVIAALKGIK